jgi:curved DNA-binding protein CbpA
MFFSLKQGLFKFDLIDHHAILGINLDADTKQVRQRYLKIVQKLHPDTCKARTEGEKTLANQLLSKLVNPAYESLSKDYGFNEHHLILAQMAKSLAKQKEKIQPISEVAKQLSEANASALDLTYRQLLQSLVADQYNNFSQSVEKIAQISELNLIYLMLKENWTLGHKKTPTSPPVTPNSGATTKVEATQSSNTTQVPTEKPTPPTEILTATPYIRRAQEYMEKNNFAQAVLELRDGIKLEPNNSTCHSLLGLAYLKQNQPTMAKVHISRACQANPQDPLAKQAKQALEKQGITLNISSNNKETETKPNNKSGGLLGSLFGNKKK